MRKSAKEWTTLRHERLAAARAKGRHTRAEWEVLRVAAGGHCPRCSHVCERLTKDHIIPLYLGGSDGIGNIRALCRSCNSSRSPGTADSMAEEVRRLRDARGESVEIFAARIWVSPRTVEDWEQGRSHPPRMAIEIMRRLRQSTTKQQRSARLRAARKSPNVPANALLLRAATEAAETAADKKWLRDRDEKQAINLTPEPRT